MTTTLEVNLDTITDEGILAIKEAHDAGKLPFGIDSLDRLAWFGRKLTAKRAEIAAVKTNADALIKSLEKDLAYFEAWLNPQAEAFTREMLAATKAKGRTVQTIGGAFSLRTVPGGIRKAEPVTLADWAREHAPELLKVTVATKADGQDGAAIKFALDQHGLAYTESADVPADALKDWVAKYAAEHEGEMLIPPGAELVPDRDVFSHKSDPEAK